jgi:acyl-CoA thioesterase
MVDDGLARVGAVTPQELAQACADAMYAEDLASQGLGIEVVAVAPGRATVRMTVRPEMVNGHAIAHGVFVFALADTAFAFACNTYGQVTVARAADVVFLAPAHVGDLLVATGQERAREGRNGVYDVTVRRGTPDGEVVAEFRGHSRELGRPLVLAD